MRRTSDAPSKLGLDYELVPAVVARQEVTVQVDEGSGLTCRLREDRIDTSVIGASQDRVDAQEIARVVTERRVVHITDEDWPNRQRGEKGADGFLECQDAASVAVSGETEAQVVASDGEDRYFVARAAELRELRHKPGRVPVLNRGGAVCGVVDDGRALAQACEVRPPGL